MSIDILGGMSIPGQTLGSLLPHGVPPRSGIQVMLPNTTASAHMLIVRPPGVDRPASAQRRSVLAAGRGPPVLPQKAPPLVHLAVIGVQIGANTLFGDSTGDIA